MWNLRQIPKKIFFYWGGGSLPYLSYLSITSFIKHNPDWNVEFYYPKVPTVKQSWITTEQKYDRSWTDFTKEVFELPIKHIAVDFEYWFGVSNQISEVHKSDFLRWGLLPYGGVWSDMDILYFAPMEDMIVNNIKNHDCDTGVTISHYGHSVGFLFSSMDNKHFINMANLSKSNFSPKQYQCIGCNLLNNVIDWHREHEGVVNIGMDAVYYYDAQHVDKIYSVGKSPKEVKGAIGCHWYAGHKLAGEFLNDTDGGIHIKGDCVLSNLIRDYEN